MGQGRVGRSSYRYASANLWFLALISAFLFIQGILVENRETRHWTPEWLWQQAVVDSGTSAALLIGLLGLLSVRAQFQLGLRPFLRYENKSLTSMERYVSAKDDSEAVLVRIQNVGLGPAIIRGITFELEFSNGIAGSSRLSFEELVDELSLHQLVNGKDYLLVNFGVGAAIGKGDDALVGEFPKPFQNIVSTLIMDIAFEGLLGGKPVDRRVNCIPETASAMLQGSEQLMSVPVDQTGIEQS